MDLAMRLLPVMTLALALATLAAAAPADEWVVEPDDGHVVYVLERTSDAPNSFRLVVGTSTGPEEETFIGLFGLAGNGEDLQVHPGLMNHASDEPIAEAYVNGERIGCPTSGCGVIGNLGTQAVLVSYDSTDSDVILDRYMVVVESDYEVHFDFEASGWTARRLLDLDFVTVRMEDVDGAVSIHGPNVGYEVFTSASVTTEYPSSIALADLPCDDVAGTSLGPSYGEATLTGGREDVTVTCEAQRVPPAGAIADAPTVWSLDGTAVGANKNMETRLLITETPATPSCDESDWIHCLP